MSSNNYSASLRKLFSSALLVALIIVIVSGTYALAARIDDLAISPDQLDNGYWVSAYREYIDRNNEYWEPLLHDYNYQQEELGYYHYAALLDLDFDGIPEVVAVKETIKPWYVTADVLSMDRNGNCDVTELYDIDMDTVVSLYVGDDGPAWILENESEYKGDYSHNYYRLKYSKGEAVYTELWLSETSYIEDWENESPENTDYMRSYFVNGEEVSFEEYKREDIMRRNMTYVSTVQLCGYTYPDDWTTACSQLSVAR